jgi:hypothetical protein
MRFALWPILAALTLPAVAGTPAHGSLIVGSMQAGVHYLMRFDYDYDGADTLIATGPTWERAEPDAAAEYTAVPGGYVVYAGGGTVTRVQMATGRHVLANASGSGTTVTVDPDGQHVWSGWRDAPLASIPLNPFGDATPHAIGGDDASATQIAFTPSGVFYTTGSDDPADAANVGRIDLATYTTTRILANTDATGMHYDPYSATLVFAAFGKAHQIDPAQPAAILSSRDDSATENYIDLVPDGLGHFLAIHRSDASCSNPANGLVLIDYSATGLLGDASTRYVAAPLAVPGCATGLGLDVDLFADGFDP